MNGSRVRSLSFLGLTAALSLVAVAPGAAGAPPPVDCSKQDFASLRLQDNLRAGQILVQCGRAPGGRSSPATGSTISDLGPLALGGADKNLITGAQNFPLGVTQSENQIAAAGTRVVVAYNDSRGAVLNPQNYGGASVSTDGGVTFSRLTPSPFTGHGDNFGDPVLVVNRKLGMGFAGFLATGNCGGQGIGLWTTTNGTNWAVGACADVGSADDREALAADNNPTSPFYGRMYMIWNDFALGGAPIVERHSDNGVNWTAQKTLSSGSFTRVVGVTVAGNGTVLAYGNRTPTQSGPKTHLLFRSTNGGVNYSGAINMAANQPAPGSPGSGVCIGRQFIPPIWRYEGAGQMGAGPNSILHYVFTRGATGDLGNIAYVRSTNNGQTWSAPIRLNTDSTTRAQWMPSLAVTPGGRVLATWYDRANTTNENYQRMGRVSNDNGVTWQPVDTVSDVVITQPQQPDPNVQACYAGDYDFSYATSNKVFNAWTDGRVSILGIPQQDVFLDQVPLP